MTLFEQIQASWKAVVAFIVPGVAILLSSVLEGSDGGSAITTAEWITAIGTCFLTAGTVWSVPNVPPKRAIEE